MTGKLKYIRNLFRERILSPVICLIAGMMFLIAGCTKPGITTEKMITSNLRVVNVLTSPGDIQVILDTFKLTFTGAMNYLEVSQYYVVNSGLRPLTFYSIAEEDTVLSKMVQLDPKNNYTAFLGHVSGKPEMILTNDDLQQPELDKIKLRLANLTDNAVPLDVTLQKEDSVGAPEVAVGSTVAPSVVSDYVKMQVPTSRGNYNINYHTIRLYNATTHELVKTLKNVDLRGSMMYTVILSGEAGTALDWNVTYDWPDY